MMFRSAIALAFVVSLLGCASSSEDTSSNGSAMANDNDNLTAETKLLDCNVFEGGGGPDQQVTIVRRDGKLVMRELTNHGSTVERPLDDREWSSKSLTLREDSPGDVATLRKTSDGWINESRGGGFRTFGFADCFVDTTKR